MPLYEFQCPKCKNIISAFRKIAERNDPLLCELDGENMTLLIGAPAIRYGAGIHGANPSTKNWGNYDE